jgi:hypothetical protein
MTLNSTDKAIPPMMPPTIAGVCDLRGGGDDPEGEGGVGDEMVGEGVEVDDATINSGLWKTK